MTANGGEGWITPNITRLFQAEIANEANGGVSPSTLASSIDSLAQGEGIMDEGWTNHDFIALLYIAMLEGVEAEVSDLLS